MKTINSNLILKSLSLCMAPMLSLSVNGSAGLVRAFHNPPQHLPQLIEVVRFAHQPGNILTGYP
jgi:hypothetical protein